MRRLGQPRWTDIGFSPWSPAGPEHHPSRALVLCGGGATGIAWEGGIIAGLREAGIDLRQADTVVGTSAGSLVGAHLWWDVPIEEALARDVSETVATGRIGAADAVRFVRGQAARRRSAGRSVVGRSALLAQTADEAAWVGYVSAGLTGQPWPDHRLLVTAVDAQSGTSVVFDKDSGVSLERAVAASCAVPGIFPAVTINGRRFVDGGVRSVGNVDLAVGHDQVLVLAPIPLAVRPSDRPSAQAKALGAEVHRLVLVPDAASRRAMGRNPLDVGRAEAALESALAQASRVADRVRQIWQG